MSNVKPRPSVEMYIDLPRGQKVTYMTTYAPERIVYPKWQFWRKQVAQYYLVLATDKNRVYVADFTNGFPQVTEKSTQLNEMERK